MPVVVLIYGLPDSGKSYLAHKLEQVHSFVVLSLDDAYVSFVGESCPKLYFEALRLYVGPHYDHILFNREYSKIHFGRDFIAEWHVHLRTRIEAMAQRYENVAVEGYLLKDFKDAFQELLPVDVRVFQIEVVNQTYIMNGKSMTLDQIADLKTT